MGSILNRLESEQTTKLLREYSISAIIGSLVVAIYNIVDSIYIGHGPNLGDHAIGGLGLVFPIMTFFTALGAFVGTGAATRVAIYMGEDCKDKMDRALSNALVLIILLTGFFVLLTYIFIDPLLHIIGATQDTYHFAREFLIYYLPCCIFLNLGFVLSSVMRASGYPQKAMYIMLLGVILNIILAPIFIFIFEWGMRGAAIATSIAAFISFVIFMIHFLDRNNTLTLHKHKLNLDKEIVWAITSIGVSPFLMQVAASIVVFFINNRLSTYGGSIAIEAYAIANRLNLVVVLIIVGLTQGMQPIVGYNYGANKIERVISTVNQAIKAGIGIGFLGLIGGLFFSDIAVSPFNPTSALASKASGVLKIITIVLPLSGLQMVISNFFQSIGMPTKAIMLSLTRQFLFLVPLLFILPLFFQLDGVWFSIPLADVASTIFAVIIYIGQIHKLKEKYTYAID